MIEENTLLQKHLPQKQPRLLGYFTVGPFNHHVKAGGIAGLVHIFEKPFRAYFAIVSTLLDRRFAVVQLLKHRSPSSDFIKQLNSMGRQTNQPVVGADISGNALTDPPIDIGGQSVAPFRIKFFDAMGEPHVALLDEVKQFRAFDLVRVLLGH